MMQPRNLLLSFLVATALLRVQGALAAEPAGTRQGPTGVGLSLEIDPVPFMAGGYSVGLGWRLDHLRLSVHAYAADVPSAVVPHGFDARIRYGLAIRGQLYLEGGARGWFAGAELGPTSLRYTRSGTAGAARVDHLSFTPTAGYRWFPWGGGLYLMPAAGVEMPLVSRGDSTLGGEPLPSRRATPLAAFHVGWEI